MTEAKKTFCKITASDQDYYLLVERALSDDLKLALSNGSDVWHGSVSGTDMEAWSQPLKMDHAEFVSETMNALTCDNVNGLHFEYLVTPIDNSTEVTFVWKKCVPRESIKFQLGRVKLRKDDRQTAVFRQIFDCVIMTETNLRQQISDLQSDNERLASERTRAQQTLDKCVTAKEDLETDMFSKFIVVINDKKAKITELKEEVETLKTNSIPSTSNIASPKSSKRQHIAEEVPQSNSPTADDSEYDTDEETKVTKKVFQPKKTKLKTEEGDSSLILDDGKSDDSPSVYSRRDRQRRGKKCAVSKPLLPKVTMPEKDATATPETTKKPLYKVPSRRRRKSSQSTLEVDDLMADL